MAQREVSLERLAWVERAKVDLDQLESAGLPATFDFATKMAFENRYSRVNEEVEFLYHELSRLGMLPVAETIEKAA